MIACLMDATKCHKMPQNSNKYDVDNFQFTNGQLKLNTLDRNTLLGHPSTPQGLLMLFVPRTLSVRQFGI